jgi:DNA-directed RNA polymerase specialized sigma24 family protein
VEKDPEFIKKSFQSILDSSDGTYERWLKYADIMIALYRLQEYLSPGDVINSIFLKLYDGERNWNREKYPDLRVYVFMIIKSFVSNFYEKQKKNMCITPLLEGIGSFATLSDAAAEELKEQCLFVLKDDSEGKEVFLKLIEFHKNQEAAKNLGIEVELVEYAKRRIQRKLKPVFEKFIEYRNDETVFIKLQQDSDEDEDAPRSKP